MSSRWVTGDPRRRKFNSLCYTRLLQAALRVGFRDAQCGFKALRADAARAAL